MADRNGNGPKSDAKKNGRPASKRQGKPTSGARARTGKPARTGAKPKPRRAPAAKAKPRKAAERAGTAPGAPSAPPEALLAPSLSDEERIESAKYLPQASRPRLFEEERFLFPETYGVNRVRLLVKDPEWLFAYWDVDPASIARLRSELGERAAALSRLTLRVSDPGNGGESLILLPEGVRSWYVRTDAAPRSYRAELGLTLPSGEFRKIAESNTVATPRVGASAERATRRISYRQARKLTAKAARAAADEATRAVAAGSGPWSAPPQDATRPEEAPAQGESSELRPLPPGGASDAHRR